MTNPQSANNCTVAAPTRMSRCWRIVTVLVVAGLLVACADDSTTTDDRRFANEPSTEVPSEATSPAQTPVASAPTPLPQASPESLLDAQDAPRFIFILLDDSIDVIDAAGSEPPRRIIAPDSRRFVAISRSPVEDRVAALTMPVAETADGRAEVVIYDRQGQILNGWSDLPSATGGIATPRPDADTVPTPAPSISWGPDVNRILVAMGGSELVSIDIDGEASVLTVPSPVQRVAHAAWSPQDDQVALLTPNADGSGAIWVFSPYVDGVSMRQVAPPNADASNLGSVTQFAWLPDGSGLAYILAEDSGAGGQLYTINLKLGIKLLVATPGRGGPAAVIVDFALSPDGKAIAYTIAIPDGDRWQFHSLWVRSVQARAVYNVPAGNPERIERLWWAGSGIAWQQQAGGTLEIVAQMAGENPVTVFTADPGGEGLAGATPVAATPAAATPMATPISATPVQATPAGATPTR
ncbi:MAG: hypothetical protein M3457_20840 [Chloroflexota bacterium]|nr:hypothetical protein [Chloroflexota bacterium]